MILSICIPTYNRLDCLDNCLNSIFIASQNVKNFKFEVCVSDNNSIKDPIETSLLEYIKLYIKYIKYLINFQSSV